MSLNLAQEFVEDSNLALLERLGLGVPALLILALVFLPAVNRALRGKPQPAQHGPYGPGPAGGQFGPPPGYPAGPPNQPGPVQQPPHGGQPS